MSRQLARLAAATVLGVATGVVPVATGASTPTPPPVPRWMTTPCDYDDGSPYDCYWNAQEQGNGVGLSFYARRMPGTDTVCFLYVTKPKRDRCVTE